jgi:hypothetical protein
MLRQNPQQQHRHVPTLTPQNTTLLLLLLLLL